MEPLSVLIVFVVAWWIVFFAVLPIGVQSQEESGEVVEGSEPGAPAAPMLRKKAIWATIGGAGLTAVAAVVISIIAP